ncbi:MAG: hypothetical protein HXS54_05910 [Theionarchaea archaeon]|nr:hypothetical protein [Theionarchaea archaeon]DBA34903.1 TPA_asm: hypothetical protein vir521_00109 [Caudoviricetes sp. vir521]
MEIFTLTPECTCGTELETIIKETVRQDWNDNQGKIEGCFNCVIKCPNCGTPWNIGYELKYILHFIVTQIKEEVST